MQKIKLIVWMLFSITMMAGCIYHESETVLTDPKDHVFPLEPGNYITFTSFDAGSFYPLTREDVKKHTSGAEFTQLSSKQFVPILREDEKPTSIRKFQNCYKADGEGVVSFVRLEDDRYIMEVRGGPCDAPRGQRIKSSYYSVVVRNNHVYELEDTTKGGFKEWALSAGSLTRFQFGIETVEKEDKKTVKLNSIKAFKKYYKEHAGNFVIGKAKYVLDSDVTKYEDKINLYWKLKAVEKKEEEKRDKKAKEAARKKEAEKHDGVIRYAFGRKLGQQYGKGSGEITGIGYVTFTDNAEKSVYFKDYYELLTPATNKVFSIYAVSDYMGAEKCRQSARKVMSILSEKYGAPLPGVPLEVSGREKKAGTDKSFLYFRRIEQKKHNRLIELIGVTDSKKIKLKHSQFLANGCRLDENLFDGATAGKAGLTLSEYNLYYAYPGAGGYSDYGNRVLPVLIPGKPGFYSLYPAPIPSMSASYNRYYRKCGLNEKNDIFRLFIRYSDTKLENLVFKENQEIQRKKKIESSEAKGL